MLPWRRRKSLRKFMEWAQDNGDRTTVSSGAIKAEIAVRTPTQQH